jgi:hypothetical protein
MLLTNQTTVIVDITSKTKLVRAAEHYPLAMLEGTARERTHARG